MDGKRAYKKKEYEAARLRFMKILELKPSHSGALKYLNLVEHKAGRLKKGEAEKEMKIAEPGELPVSETLKDKKIAAKRLLVEGKKAYGARNYKEAKLKFEEVLTFQSDHKAARKYVAAAEKKVEEEKAKKLLAEGKKAYGAGDWEEAKLKFEEVLTFQPDQKAARQYVVAAEKKLEERDAKRKKEGWKAKVIRDLNRVTVDDCVAIAIENSIALRAADKQTELAQYKVWEAMRRFFPAVSIKYEDLAGTEYTAGREYKGETYAIEGQQALYRGGEYMIVLKQAKLNLRIAEENKKKIRNEIIASAKGAFYSMARAKETLEIQEDFYNESEVIYRSVNKQYEKGVCSELELLDVESRYNMAYYQYISSEEDLKLAKVILKQAIDLDPAQDIDIKYSLEYERVDPDLKTCIDMALKNRAKIKINELVLGYTELGKKLATAKGRPKLEILGSYGESGEAFKEDTLIKEEQWYVGAKVDVPFGGSTAKYAYTQEQNAPVLSTAKGTETTVHSYKVSLLDNLQQFSIKKQAAVEYEEALNELRKKREEVTLEVEEHFYNYLKALIRVDASASKVKFQAKEAEIYRLRRSLGGTVDSQVMESIMKLSQQRFAYIQAITDYFIAVANLNKAIGVEDYLKP